MSSDSLTRQICTRRVKELWSYVRLHVVRQVVARIQDCPVEKSLRCKELLGQRPIGSRKPVQTSVKSSLRVRKHLLGFLEGQMFQSRVFSIHILHTLRNTSEEQRQEADEYGMMSYCHFERAKRVE